MEQAKLTAKIILGGVEKEIKKLKAGKFFEAQRIFADMISAASSPSDVKEGKNESAQMVKIFTEFPEKQAKFVAYCAEIEEKEILEDAYPEEISTAFGVCLELNNVIENLKNSVAPMEKLGETKK